MDKGQLKRPGGLDISGLRAAIEGTKQRDEARRLLQRQSNEETSETNTDGSMQDAHQVHADSLAEESTWHDPVPNMGNQEPNHPEDQQFRSQSERDCLEACTYGNLPPDGYAEEMSSTNSDTEASIISDGESSKTGGSEVCFALQIYHHGMGEITSLFFIESEDEESAKKFHKPGIEKTPFLYERVQTKKEDHIKIKLLVSEKNKAKLCKVTPKQSHKIPVVEIENKRYIQKSFLLNPLPDLRNGYLDLIFEYQVGKKRKESFPFRLKPQTGQNPPSELLSQPIAGVTIHNNHRIQSAKEMSTADTMANNGGNVDSRRDKTQSSIGERKRRFSDSSFGSSSSTAHSQCSSIRPDS